jgi:hypothetical protein
VAETPSATDLLRLLAAHERLRVVAALVLGASSTDDVVAATALPQRTVLEALGRLEVGGLVDRDDSAGWRLLTERFAEARPVVAEEPGDYPQAGPGAAAVLQRFIRGGRLLSIPTQRSKRLVVLDHLARMFEPGARYTEREVSDLLGTVYDDYAALRRYLVDEGFLSREAGIYWRIGGTVDI